MALDAALLRSSFQALAPHAPRLADVFYDTLFSRYPGVRPLFKGVSMPEQKKKLIAALALVVKNLERPEALRAALGDMGQRHVGYGAKASHYPAVGECLLAALETVAGDLWTPQLTKAWGDAYAAVADLMLAGARRSARTRNGGRSAMATVTKNGRRTNGHGTGPEQAGLMARVEALFGMVDHLGTNVLVADAELTLVYMNRRSYETLTAIEPVLRQALGLGVSDLVGGSIDRFHGARAGQIRRLLGDRRSFPYHGVISLGPKRLDLNVNILEEDGAIAGYVVNWEDVTEKERFQSETARLQSMMDNLPINVLLADREFTLVYMNPASQRTLKKIEHLLPTPVDRIVGQKIDIFHKNPEHQRRIVGDQKNLPHKANITLGPETLALEVSPVLDKQGAYVFTMVTWAVVTEQEKLKEDVRAAVATVTESKALRDLPMVSQNMSAAAEETARQSQAVAAAAEQATRNVQTVASSAEQMAASVREISGRVQEASNVAQRAVKEAATTNDTMKKLGTSSQEIGQVVKVITSIAQQTNLLALNATIEAARAGEAGKGFAVVANEVKELARQTAKATEEIGQKIAGVQSDTESAVKAIHGIGQTISQVNEIATAIAASVEEQSAATGEISRNAMEAARGTADVTQNIGTVSSVALESGKTASELKAAAETLAQQGAHLKVAVATALK